jgi:intermembrane space import and assembly protein 40
VGAWRLRVKEHRRSRANRLASPVAQSGASHIAPADEELATVNALIEEKRRQLALSQPPPPPPPATEEISAVADAVIEELEEPKEEAPAVAAEVREQTAVEGAEPGSPEALEEEAGQQGAFNPETGEINWDCPCLGGMAHGPCGEEFKTAFSCFVYSKEEPKGIECIEKFQ